MFGKLSPTRGTDRCATCVPVSELFSNNKKFRKIWLEQKRRKNFFSQFDRIEQWFLTWAIPPPKGHFGPSREGGRWRTASFQMRNSGKNQQWGHQQRFEISVKWALNRKRLRTTEIEPFYSTSYSSDFHHRIQPTCRTFLL